jgi:hypothetical protein
MNFPAFYQTFEAQVCYMLSLLTYASQFSASEAQDFTIEALRTILET